jgi:tripartite-type tricarboxylate transporter receptor subunit TctC
MSAGAQARLKGEAQHTNQEEQTMTKTLTPFARPTRRKLVQLSAGAAALPFVSSKAWAQAYPSRTITLVVFTPAGAIPDIIGRLIGEGLSQRLGQPVIIENRPGAGGLLAMQAVARAPADGYTLLLLASPHTIAVSLYPDNPVTISRDVAPVASLNRDAFVLLVNPSFPAKTIAEFIAYAKANPGKVNLASNGTGNLTHLTGELFRMTAGIETQHVPYRGTPAAFTALMGGEVQALFDTSGASLPLIQSGRLRALGVTTAQRRPALPDVPPIGETLPGFDVIGWLGVSAPRDTPAEIVQRLNREINAVLADPMIKTRMTDLGSDQFVSSSPAEFAKFLTEDANKWGNVVKASGLKMK